MNNILLIIKDAVCYFGYLRRDEENAIHSLKARLSWGKMQSAGRKQGPHLQYAQEQSFNNSQWMTGEAGLRASRTCPR